MKDLTENIQKNPHLVVIDDDESIRELVEAFFKQKNYTITSFENSESFLDKVKADGHKWDVVLSDLNLPVFSGIELTEKIKAFHPHLPVILITTNRNAQTA